MIEVPWWALSPSPFSVLFWVLLASYGVTLLPKQNVLKGFVKALFVVGLTVLSFDASWVVLQLIKFGSHFPGSVLQLIVCLARDLAGLLLCYIMTYDLFKQKILEVTYSTGIFYCLLWAFMATWFFYSPSPAFTDWTYAIRFGYDCLTVTYSFIISHVFAKFLQGLIFFSMWKGFLK